MDDSVNEKLVRSKRAWAEQGRLLTGTSAERGSVRLPPGQRLVTDWPVLDLGAQPDVTPQRFRLDIAGAVRRPLSLTLAEFMALPQQDFTSDIHCVTQWSRYDNRWQGVAARALLDLVDPREDAAHVIFHAFDGYTTNVRLDQFAAGDVLLAHSWDGRPLERQHGGPVRVVIPALYFWKSPKWIQRIELSPVDKPGFWERNGYHNNADPWTEERYST
jgi:DMSO/TMAO reductase YedYZ molybdopterin-dependent catalytic subunit